MEQQVELDFHGSRFLRPRQRPLHRAQAHGNQLLIHRRRLLRRILLPRRRKPRRPQMPKGHNPMAARQIREKRRRLAQAAPYQGRRPPDVLGPMPVQELGVHALQRDRDVPEIRSPHRRLPQNQAPQPLQIRRLPTHAPVHRLHHSADAAHHDSEPARHCHRDCQGEARSAAARGRGLVQEERKHCRPGLLGWPLGHGRRRTVVVVLLDDAARGAR